MSQIFILKIAKALLQVNHHSIKSLGIIRLKQIWVIDKIWLDLSQAQQGFLPFIYKLKSISQLDFLITDSQSPLISLYDLNQMRRNKHKFSQNNIRPFDDLIKSRDKLSKSKSPTLRVTPTHSKSVIVYQFEQIEEAKLQNKIKINDSAMKKITLDRDIRQKTEARVKKRVVNKNMFLDYKVNPFLPNHIKYSMQDLLNHGLRKKSFQKQNNIVDQLSNLKDKQIIRPKAQKLKNSHNRIQECSQFSMKNLNIHKNSIPNNKSEIQQLTSHIKSQMDQQKSSINLEDALKDLNKIVQMKESKYIGSDIQDFNIFTHFSKDSCQPSYLKCFKRHNFSQNSIIISSNQNNFIAIEKNISSLLRRIAKKINVAVQDIDFIFNISSLVVNLNQIKFNDLIATSDGWLNSQSLIGVLKNYQRKLPVQEQKQKQIIMNDNQRMINKATNACNQDYDVREIKNYHNIPFYPNQKKHKMMMKDKQEEMKNLLKYQISLNEKSIKDRKIMEDIENNKNQILNNHFNNMLDPRAKKMSLDMGKKVRYLKQSKSRVENIGIHSVVQSIMNKKIYESKFKDKRKMKSNSISLINK